MGFHADLEGNGRDPTFVKGWLFGWKSWRRYTGAWVHIGNGSQRQQQRIPIAQQTNYEATEWPDEMDMVVYQLEPNR